MPGRELGLGNTVCKVLSRAAQTAFLRCGLLGASNVRVLFVALISNTPPLGLKAELIFQDVYKSPTEKPFPQVPLPSPSQPFTR